MNHPQLHSQFLEAQYGPIRLEIISQGGGMRMVHLFDGSGISRTLGVVHFYGEPPEPYSGVHKRILDGSPLGPTLLEAGLDFEKRPLGRFWLRMPDWLKRAFGTAEPEALCVLSDGYLRNPDGRDAFRYVRVLEVIPPEVNAHMTAVATAKFPGPEADILLNYAKLQPHNNN